MIRGLPQLKGSTKSADGEAVGARTSPFPASAVDSPTRNAGPEPIPTPSFQGHILIRLSFTEP
jgi:hypothetical protein